MRNQRKNRESFDVYKVKSHDPETGYFNINGIPIECPGCGYYTNEHKATFILESFDLGQSITCVKCGNEWNILRPDIDRLHGEHLYNEIFEAAKRGATLDELREIRDKYLKWKDKLREK